MSAKSILIVDDSLLFLSIIKSALEQAGYTIEVASGPEALSCLDQEVTFDMVLMDVQMPEAFGDDIANVMRNAYGLAIPIYLLSSLADSELSLRVNEAGIDGYISKNIGFEAIVARVEEILAGSDPAPVNANSTEATH